VEAAESALARSSPPVAGWDMPGFQPSATFSHWLCSLAHRLHSVYAPSAPVEKLPVNGLLRLQALLSAMQLDLAAKLRVGVDCTCILLEPADTPAINDERWEALVDESPPSFCTTSWSEQQQQKALLAASSQSSEGRPGKRQHRRTSVIMEEDETSGLGARLEKGSTPQGRAKGKRGSVQKAQSGGGGGRNKPQSKELGSEDIVLTGLVVDGGVWSSRFGLFVDRTITGLTRLPPLRARAATPRAAEIVLHQSFREAHGCLELPVHRILSCSWFTEGAVSGQLEDARLCTLRLPFFWGPSVRRWHPVALFDAASTAPPGFFSPSAAAAAEAEADASEQQDTSYRSDETDEEAPQRRQTLKGRLRQRPQLLRPCALHPAAVGLLTEGGRRVGGCSLQSGP